MKYYNYFYYILQNMKQLEITNKEANLLFFLRYFSETNQEVDMDVISEQLNVEINEVVSMIETLMEKKYICLSRNGKIQYDTNIIYNVETIRQKENQSQLIKKFEMGFNRLIGQKEVEKINDLLQQYPQKLIEYALRETVIHSASSVNYVEKILMNWKKKNFTVEDYENGNG